MLRIIAAEEELPNRNVKQQNDKTKAIVHDIFQELASTGRDGLLNISLKLGDISSTDDKIYYNKADLAKAYENLPTSTQDLLQRTAHRIAKFALAQKAAFQNITIDIPAGQAGHNVVPVEAAGCYAPGGHYPLPSSVLMTAVTAHVAGVKHIYVASPHPSQITLAAALVGEADGLLAIGGAQAIAALAFGISPIPKACDVIVGPGNKYVTMAKHMVSSTCSIDMLAGPSEVLVIADDTSDAEVIACDLLAQAEHDSDACPMLLSTSLPKIYEVNLYINQRVSTLSTGILAKKALQNGFAKHCLDITEAINIANAIAPEHLEIHTANAHNVAKQCHNYGSLFIGENSAEVFGDYGAGPNHVLPTQGTAKHCSGLNVFSFLKVQTWIEMPYLVTEQGKQLVDDCIALARMEGLEGHAQAVEIRRNKMKNINSA